MFEKGQRVHVTDVEKVKQDPFMEANSLKIMEASNFTGEITKIEDGIHFVGFMNDHGWITQGFKADEIEEVGQ
ncbi:hypothetical protein [Siminovitchia terrae]|uniref:hypothetical protein n=1 Tax=Siminovitchia terrae TaxID=1914933 RepID=UPI0028AF92EA|nr:hypothetical protein [Siminovitchia terrae]